MRYKDREFFTCFNDNEKGSLQSSRREVPNVGHGRARPRRSASRPHQKADFTVAAVTNAFSSRTTRDSRDTAGGRLKEFNAGHRECCM
ncbi:hypothetical protein EVAR_37673_1 [Eumeta japonica]|uniref:Uncharacterized protein n=1 Tax=Eumeta variegata TaxID=151549 RepID=A0A4C1Z146_EUMVA|nr:hypothetical protein EVAR_37673_1 [Eumeta japonica]